MPSIGDARLVADGPAGGHGAWEGWANEWVPLDRFPMPAWAVQISVNPTTAQVIFQDENGNWSDIVRNPIRGTFVPKEEGETPEERAERERNLVEAAREIIRSETGREPTGSEDQQLQRILLAGEDVLREARRLAALGAVPGGYETEEVLTGPEAMALGAVEGQRVIVTRNPDGSIRDIDLQDAPDPFAEVSEALEAERRLVEARRATDIAQKSRSVDQQFDAAVDAGDLDKARLIRNFKDEPSEWQIELLKMEYADNPAALKVLFDYVDAIGRADVVSEEARQLAEPAAPQPLSPLARKRIVDPLGFEAELSPDRLRELPPGFGTSKTSGVGTNKSFPTASEFQDPAAALRRGASTFRGFVPPEAEEGTFAEQTAGFSQRDTPGAPVPPTSSTAGGLDVSGGMQGTPGATLFSGILPSEGGVVRLIINGVMTSVHAEFADQVAERAVSEGKTVEGFRGGKLTFLSDPNITSFGGAHFRVTPRFTAEQLLDPRFLQAVGSGLHPATGDIGDVGAFQERGPRPDVTAVNVTQEELDRITAAAADPRRGITTPGQVRFVNPATGDVQISSYTTQADIDEFLSQRPEFVELDRTEAPNAPGPVLDSLGRAIKQPVFGPSRAEREASFIKEAQAFAPKKKTPKPFGTPRFVTT